MSPDTSVPTDWLQERICYRPHGRGLRKSFDFSRLPPSRSGFDSERGAFCAHLSWTILSRSDSSDWSGVWLWTYPVLFAFYYLLFLLFFIYCIVIIIISGSGSYFSKVYSIKYSNLCTFNVVIFTAVPNLFAYFLMLLDIYSWYAAGGRLLNLHIWGPQPVKWPQFSGETNADCAPWYQLWWAILDTVFVNVQCIQDVFVILLLGCHQWLNYSKVAGGTLHWPKLQQNPSDED